MDGSKQPFISPQDLYGAIGTPCSFSSRRSGAFAADNRVIAGAIRLNPNAWTELKPSFLPASESYAVIGTNQGALVAPRGDLQCQSSQIIVTVRWPLCYIGLGHRNRPAESQPVSSCGPPLSESMLRAAEPHPGQASRSCIALRHRLVASASRAVRYRPFAGVFDSQGIELARTVLAAADLINGRLMRPFPTTLLLKNTCWIVCPKATSGLPKIVAFRDWLLAEAAADARQLNRTWVKPASGQVESPALVA
jgi:hypothetical protein